MKKIKKYFILDDGVKILTQEDQELIIKKEEISKTFKKYGGSFMQTLGLALDNADNRNTIKILIGWHKEVQEYITKFIL